MKTENMLWFSQRKKLEEMFVEWALENDAAQTPMNMVGWLTLNNLVDIDAAYNLIKRKERGTKYKLNPSVCKEKLLESRFKVGSWRHDDSTDEWYSKCYPLCGEMDLTVHINMTTKKWDEFEDTDVIDDDFGQPYGPFYDCYCDGAPRFEFVDRVIEAYCKRMDALADAGILIKV